MRLTNIIIVGLYYFTRNADKNLAKVSRGMNLYNYILTVFIVEEIFIIDDFLNS